MTQEDQDRYAAAAHAMQTGVAMQMNFDPSETTPKHLRVGVNSAMVEHGALVKILLDKGLLTEDEYYKTLADFMEAEAESYRARIQEMYPGTKITLG